MNTEEGFILANLKEFVKLWGSGTHASFYLECRDKQAWFKLSSFLGSPGSCHFSPSHVQNEDNGIHEVKTKRRKGPSQLLRNQARAAAHRASKSNFSAENPQPAAATAEDNSAAPADVPSSSPPPSPLPPSHAVPASSPPTHSSKLAVPASPPPAHHPPQQAVPASPHPTHSQQQAAPASPTPTQSQQAVPAVPLPSSLQDPIGTDSGTAVSASEVQDELVQEQCEVKVTGIGVFENCPDANLSKEYFESLKKFVLSESHLQDNISSVKIAQLSSRQLGTQLYEHSVKVEIFVRTARLWEPASAYIRKHLSRNDWLKGNKTRITIGRIQ